MSDTVLAIIELDRFPEEVATRAAWIARRFECDLELVLSDPTLAVLHDSFIVSNEAQLIADNIKGAQSKILDELAESAADRRLKVTSTILDDRPAADEAVGCREPRRLRLRGARGQQEDEDERDEVLHGQRSGIL